MTALLAQGAEHGHAGMSWLFTIGALLVLVLSVGAATAGRWYGWVPRPTPQVAELPREQKRLVLAAVARGEAAPDAALALAALGQARRAEERLENYQGGWIAVWFVLAGLNLVVAGLDVSNHDYAGAVFQVVISAVWVVNGWLQRFQYRRACRSAELNYELLRPASSPLTRREQVPW